MLIHKSHFKTIFPIFLSILFVLGYSYFAGAVPAAKMQFTADTILNMSGTVSGDLIAASGSMCDQLDILGKDLTITAIPLSGNFTLKTPIHANALKITPSGSSANLAFNTDSLINGEISTFILSGSATSADITWGVPAAATRYAVKVNGIALSDYTSNSNREISFVYNQTLSSPRTFTLELSTGGAAFMPPAKPDVSGVDISPSQDGKINLDGVPENIYQIAISHTPDFKDASWQAFDADKFKTIGNTDETLYVKFRTQNGGVSDVIVYTPSISAQSINDGDIVKTSDNFDVYIIKLKNDKKFKRLILSPSVFNSYQHLKWGNIKTISQAKMDSYVISSLVKETDDAVIYELFPNGDAGERKAFDISNNYDPDSIYEINAVDRDSYLLIK